jgi:hypothetical protein
MIRGNNKNPIFGDDAAKMKMLDCVLKAKKVSGCMILAYCVMDIFLFGCERTWGGLLGG